MYRYKESCGIRISLACMLVIVSSNIYNEIDNFESVSLVSPLYLQMCPWTKNDEGFLNFGQQHLKMSRVNAMSWTVDDVQAWLLQQGPSVAISEVMESFKQNEVDGATLLELTSSDLQDELRIKSLGVRKALLKSVHQLQYLEGSRHLKNAITVQLEISTEDLALDKEVLKAQSCDFAEAARIWQEDLIQIRQVMEDAEFSNQVQSVELGMQRHSHANMEVARELQAHVDRLRELERYDAQVATAVDAARTEDQVQQALARADVPPEAPQVVAEQPEAEPPQAGPAQAGQSEPQAQPPQAEPAQASREQQEPPKPTKLPADQGSVAAASASAASSSSYEPGAAASSSTQLMSVKKTKCASCFEMKSNVTKLRCEHAMCNGSLSKSKGTFLFWRPKLSDLDPNSVERQVTKALNLQ